MDAYIFRADIYCEPCALAIRERHTKKETDDSETYPQGPYSGGGGEADAPQHCGSCGAFLENALTHDGRNYVWDALAEHARGEGGSSDTLRQWAACYKMDYCAPLSVTLDDLKSTYSLDDDDLLSAMSVWFDIAGELYRRGEDIPAHWRYSPGMGSSINRDSMYAAECAGAPSAVLFEFAEIVAADVARLKAEEESEDAL